MLIYNLSTTYCGAVKMKKCFYCNKESKNPVLIDEGDECDEDTEDVNLCRKCYNQHIKELKQKLELAKNLFKT